MLLMRANWEGWALEIETFLGPAPCAIASSRKASAIWGAQKSRFHSLSIPFFYGTHPLSNMKYMMSVHT